MSDPKRLRELSDPHGQCSLGTRLWAADEIERLEAALNAVYHHAPINHEYGYQGIDADAMFFIAKKALAKGEQ